MKSIDQQLFLGFELIKNKDHQAAIKVGKEILDKRYNIDALVLCGIAYFETQDFYQAQDYLRKAFNERSQNETITRYLLESYINTQDTQEALNCIKKLKTKSVETNILHINFLELDGEYNQAIDLALQLKDRKKYQILAWNYEQTNQLKPAKKHAQKGLQNEKNNFKCNIVLSKINLRKNKLRKAKKYLKNIQLQHLSHTNKSIYYALKAQICEKKGAFRKAFKTYTKSNHVLKSTQAYKNLKGYSYYTFDKIKIIDRYFSSQPKISEKQVSNDNITFMLGFPRSGTTLLENILNSHSEISSIEEKPTVHTILKTFLETPESIQKIETITSNEIKALQSEYIDKRKAFCPQNNTIIIDKMPLNLIHIGLLYRVFPNAKFIISTRDIRDVALSCYFQNFGINDAMAYFLDWKTTQKYLKAIMTLGLKIINSYPIKYKIVEYEKFVEAPYENIKEILSFLDLDWQEDIVDYRKKLIGKNINTPSYAKISEKINTKQRKRWENYKEKFQ